MDNPSQIPFQEIIDALLDTENILKPTYLYRLTDLGPEEARILKRYWGEIDPKRKRTMMEDLESLSDADVLLAFEEVAKIGMKDEDPEVRVISIRILWHEDTIRHADSLVDLLENDENDEVRAGAASALGNFVYLGWLDEIPKKKLDLIEARLLEVIRSTQPVLVRRRALEAMGYSCRPEMPGIIEDAFISDDDDWLVSSLFAMGRSHDKRWNNDVFNMLNNNNSAIRLEAARAAGELEIEKAREALIELLEDPDDGVRAAAIWSLSQVGGSDAEEALNEMLEITEDEEEIELIEAAIDNLAFFSGLDTMDLFDFDEDDFAGMIHETNGKED